MTTKRKSISTCDRLSLKAICTVLFCSCALFASAQSGSPYLESQYLFPDFDSCQIKMKSGAINNVIANYNTITEKLVFMKDGTPHNLTNTTSVDTLTIRGRQFIPVKDAFYEILIDAPISLFIENKSDLIDPGKPAAYGGRSQTSAIDRVSSMQNGDLFYNLEIPDEYNIKPSPVFWIRKDLQMSSFLSKRQFLKIFPDQKDVLEEYMKQNNLKTDNAEDMIKLVEFCNEIMP